MANPILFSWDRGPRANGPGAEDEFFGMELDDESLLVFVPPFYPFVRFIGGEMLAGQDAQGLGSFELPFHPDLSGRAGRVRWIVFRRFGRGHRGRTFARWLMSNLLVISEFR